MTIGSLSIRGFYSDAGTTIGAARSAALLSTYWANSARAFDVIYALGMFGVLGTLPLFVKMLAQFAGYVILRRRESPREPRRVLLTACALSLLALQGCAVVAVGDSKSPAEAGAPNMIRTLGPDQMFSNLSALSVARRIRTWHADETLTILAMSGGGADGAFGAGALVGLTRSGSRPQYTVVTGVSAGALIAPYAFLGSAWDAKLVEIYTTGQAKHLLRPRALGALFGPSIYRGAPLKDLVDRYVTDSLVQAVAHEAAAGRLLLIVTTDVETGEPVAWDLGSIAMNGGPRARTMFRDVLLASASVPGMFPPVIIRVQEQRTISEETHVDGSVSVPFLVPAGFADAPSEVQLNQSRRASVYVLIDGRLSEGPKSVQLTASTILSRSVSAGLNHMLRTTLEFTAMNADLHGVRNCSTQQYPCATRPPPRLTFVPRPHVHFFSMAMSARRPAGYGSPHRALQMMEIAMDLASISNWPVHSMTKIILLSGLWMRPMRPNKGMSSMCIGCNLNSEAPYARPTDPTRCLIRGS